MSSTPTRNNRPPGQLSLPSPPENPFAESALLTSNDNTPHAGSPRSNPTSPNKQPKPSRFSYRAMSGRRRISDARKYATDEEIQQLLEEPELPPAVPTLRSDASSTPLPILPMLVLAIAMLGEFLSANVSTPFLLFMVESFDVAEDEAQVGYLTGVLASVFFITQFFTSLLWSTVANKHGTRAVLFVSLLGNAITCVIFGTSRSYSEAIVIRLAQGVFNGAVGVARGNVALITAPDNEGRAYAILGFCWGMGGVTGAILGGTFESPALKFAAFDTPFWRTYPYLLPTAIASCVTLTGAFLSLFLAWDGGPRNGAIRLPDKEVEPDREQSSTPMPTMHEEDEDSAAELTPTAAAPEAMQQEPPEHPDTFVTQLQKNVTKRLSGYFAHRVREHQGLSPSPGHTPPSVSARQQHRSVSGPARPRAGSAYGYGARAMPTGLNGLRSRHASIQTFRRRRSSGQGMANMEEGMGDAQPTEHLSLAQRLLMANEFTVTSMGDLWVASALNTETEQVFDETPADSDEEETSLAPPEIGTASRQVSGSNFGRFATIHTDSPRGDRAAVSGSTLRRFSTVHADSPRGERRFSVSSAMPSILNNTGLVEPPATMGAADPFVDTSLQPIVEGQVARSEQHTPVVEAPPPGGLWSNLPLVIIFQYGMLALHNTTHDQIFYSYLVSKYESGGLGLNPGGFAQLIALMSIAQMIFQFVLYPSVGPPRGRFSHLAMFRIGSLLFIPAYLSVIPYRLFTNAEGGGYIFVMIGLALSTATRYCGSTFCYTAVAVLLNYMSPPPVVGMANGLAQSVVSLSRFIGPVLGGYIWSVSVQDHASGYTFGFFIVSMICGLAILHSMTIR
ncbi:major facilitator superfamily MFS-1 [Calocera cornea HHB12733]|uniref:Major facilitator superfamily MFS-1 n=1 Tax=Calocera cornea HHB12733 TaxID=1353952 RepID=A0A165ISV7_9BASI|nr:major facilitator superfamily MFS-1 [Calocera cornea HHB12733]